MPMIYNRMTTAAGYTLSLVHPGYIFGPKMTEKISSHDNQSTALESSLLSNLGEKKFSHVVEILGVWV